MTKTALIQFPPRQAPAPNPSSLPPPSPRPAGGDSSDGRKRRRRNAPVPAVVRWRVTWAPEPPRDESGQRRLTAAEIGLAHLLAGIAVRQLRAEQARAANEVAR